MKRSNLFFHIKTDRVSKKILLDVKFNHFFYRTVIFFSEVPLLKHLPRSSNMLKIKRQSAKNNL